MFRGGLQRGEGHVPSGPMAEFAAQIRDRIEHPGVPHAAPAMPAAAPSVMPAAVPSSAPAAGVRDALMMALEELVACRAAIDQVLARRQS